MRSEEEVALVLELVRARWNDCEIARETGIPRAPSGAGGLGALRTSVVSWATAPSVRGTPRRFRSRRIHTSLGSISEMDVSPLAPASCTSSALSVQRGTPTCRQCELAMAEVLPNKVGRIRKTNEGCWEVYSFSKHWPCLFPQHGPGRKHERKIELTPWQQELVALDPRPLVRGLLHSDGCRVLYWVNGTPYPRYHFSNVSADIRGIFGRACDQLGIEWRPNNRWSLSVARRGAWPCWTSSWGRSDERG